MPGTATSIRQKLRMAMMLTIAVVLALTAAPFVAYELITHRRSLIEYVQSIGDIVAANSTAATIFTDQKTAIENLSTLDLERYVVAAAIYDVHGKLFAQWPTNSTDFPAAPPPDGYVFANNVMLLATPIQEDAKRSGTLFLRADLAPMRARFRLYALIVSAVLISSLIVAYYLSDWLQKGISGPIGNLARTAKVVAIEHDYSVRAAKQTNDEVGLLTDAFNHMLTQIHHQAEALRQNEERLRLALESSGTGTWELNFETNAVSGDTYFEPLFGIERGAFAGNLLDLGKYIHGDDRAGFLKTLSKAIENRKEFSAQFRVVRPDGSVRHLASRGRAIYDAHGKPLRMTGVVLDITDAQEAAQALRESEERFRSMADAAPVMIWVGAGDASRTYFNRTWLTFTGRSMKEEAGLGWLENLHPEDRDPAIANQKQACSKRESFTMEYRLRREDGEYRWLLETGAPRFTTEGNLVGYVGSCFDITERKVAESELERRVRERTSELALTNQELESFTYSVSHDLRAPLRHIDGYAQILEEDFAPELSPEAKNYVNRIRLGTRKMGQLVDDLLNLARVGRAGLTLVEVNLKELVSDVAEDLEADTKGREIEWRIAELPTVRGDAGLLKQVFVNLLSNAVKYTRPRAVAIIEVGQQPGPDGDIVFFVRDNGVGFNMKYVHKLFGVFQRLHRPEEFEGTGVGLATVDRIIRKHGGRIWVEAELDKGATFYFTLPAADAESSDDQET